MFGAHAIEKLMLHGIFDGDSFIGIEREEAIE
jgi:hypothetical protein